MKLTSKSLTLFIPIFWLNITFVSAQTEPDTTLAHQYYILADSLSAVAKYDSSNIYFRKASVEYQIAQSWDRHFECLNDISYNYFNQAKYGLALKQIEKVIDQNSEYLGKNSLQQAKAFDIKSFVYTKEGLYDSALNYGKKSLNIKKSQLEPINTIIINSYSNMASIYTYAGIYDSAMKYFQYALPLHESEYGKMHPKTASIYNNLAGLFFHTAQVDSCLKYSLKALNILKNESNSNPNMIAAYLANIAELYSQIGYYDESIQRSNESLEIKKRILPVDHPSFGFNYHTLGVVYFHKRNYDLSLEHNKRSLAIYEKAFGENHIDLAYPYFEIARVYQRKKEYSKAVFFHKKALVIRKKNLGENDTRVADSYENIAMTYSIVNLDSAKEYIEKCIAIRERNFDQNQLSLASSYNVLSDLFLKQYNYDSALAYYEKSLILMKQGYGERSPAIVNVYNSIGALYRKKTLNQKALLSYDGALIANNIPNPNTNLNIQLMLNSAMDSDHLLSTLLGKALTNERLAISNASLEDLKLSLSSLRSCDTLINNIRQKRVRYNDKVDLGKSINEVYESAIRVSLKLHERTNETQYRHMAFYFAERNKANLLSESLSDQSAKSFGLIPDSLLMFEKHLKIDLSYAQSKRQEAISKNDSTKIDQWQDKLFTLNRSNDSLIAALEENYPQYHKLKYKSNTKNIDEIQSELDSDQVLIEYFVADSITYVFTITKDKYEIHQLPMEANPNEVVGKFRASLNASISGSKESQGQLTKQLYGLYDQFLDPVLESLDSTITKLIVIPDGALSYVPFEILLTQPADTTRINYQSLDYLLNKYQVQYGYSASLQFHNPERKSSRSMNNLVAFAPVYDGAEPDSIRRLALGNFRASVSPLKWNQAEVENISEYFEGTSYKAEQATEKTFKEAVKDNSIVHLSMHAFVDDQDPMNSKLVFTQDNDSIEDGFLYAHEIYNMNLKAQMVVLSACETGFGKLAKGEGIMSLGRAFSYAGCPSMVMSHWNVNDQATSRLMKSFYKHLSLEETKDEALRNAKLDFLQNSDAALANPFFWGSFVVTGDTSPIRTKNEFSQWLFIAVICLLILVLGGFYVRRK